MTVKILMPATAIIRTIGRLDFAISTMAEKAPVFGTTMPAMLALSSDQMRIEVLNSDSSSSSLTFSKWATMKCSPSFRLLR